MSSTFLASLALAGLFLAPVSSAQQSPEAALDVTIERLEARTANDPGLVLELFELVRDNPQLMPRMVATLRSDTVSLETSDALIFSLGKVATPDAQQTLASIQADTALHETDRIRAIMAMGAVAEPTEATLDTLWDVALARDASAMLSDVALLHLGIAGSGLRVHESPGYAAMRDGLVQIVHTAGDAYERSVALKAVGNLHDPAVSVEVSAYLLDHTAPVRASAAQALGMLGDPSATPVLASLLETEARGAVRAAVTAALRQLPRDEGALRTVLSLVQDERNAEARATMVRYLLDHLKTFDEARPTLRAMVSRDPSNRVRMIASSVLRG